LTEALKVEPMQSGLGGGFLLQQVDQNDGTVKYYFADYLTVFAIEQNLVGTANRAAKRFRKKLPDASLKAKIDIPLTVILQPKNPDALLGLMGLRNEPNVSFVPSDVIRFLDAPENPDPLSMTQSKQECGKDLSEKLAKLIV
jgi:hypothetical protein